MAKKNKELSPPVTTTTTTTTRATNVDPPEFKWPGPTPFPPIGPAAEKPKTIFGFIRDPAQGFWSGLDPVFKAAVSALSKFSEEELKATVDNYTKTKASAWISPPVVASPDELLEANKGVADVSIAMHALASGIIAGTALVSSIPFTSIGDAVDEIWRVPIINAYMGVVSDYHRSYYDTITANLLRRLWFHQKTPLLPEPYRLAEMVTKRMITGVEYEQAMKESGLASKWATAWAEAQYTAPDPETALVMLRRGIINEETFNVFLERRQYTDWQKKAYLGLKDVIPPIQDLRLMAVREAFDVPPGEPQYKEMEKWATKMGLNPEWTKRYLYMGFRRMDVDEAMRYFLWYNNLPDDYESWLRIADIHPDDRAKVKTVSYTVPSIREMGYGYDMGVYTEEDIVEMRRRGGLRPDDSIKAGKAMVEYRVAAEKEAVRREHLTAFAKERIDESTFVQALLDLGTPDTAVPLWLERGQLMRDRLKKPEIDVEYRIVTSSEALWMFKHKLRVEDWTRSKLKDLDWDDERINVALERIRQELKEEEKPPKPVTYRDLSVTQIRDLYRMEKIVKDDVEARLVGLGYDPADAKLLAELMTYIPPEEAVVKPYTDAWSRNMYAMRLLDEVGLYDNYKALGYDDRHAEKLVLFTLVDEAYPMLIAQYRKGWISEEGFLKELIWIGMDADDAIALLERTIDEFKLERLERERELTKAEVLKGAKTGVITRREAGLLLEGIGYDEWEAEYILDIEKIVGAGDPSGYWEMRRNTELLKKARGQPYRDIPDDLIMLEVAIGKKKDEIKKAEELRYPDKKIAELNVELGDLEKTLRARIISEKLE